MPLLPNCSVSRRIVMMSLLHACSTLDEWQDEHGSELRWRTGACEEEAISHPLVYEDFWVQPRGVRCVGLVFSRFLPLIALLLYHSSG